MSEVMPKMPSELARSAFELFGERGFDNVTIDEIAAHAGVTKGSFYSHYRAKHEVILAACAYYYRTYHQQVAEVLASDIDPLLRLNRVLEHAVRMCVRDDQSRVFTTEVFALSLQDDEVRRSWSQFYDSVREIYVGMLLALQASGKANISDPRRSVELMLAAIEGIKMQAVLAPHISEPNEQQSIVDGLLKILISET